MDYYGTDFKAFTVTAIDTFRRLKPVYHAENAGFDTLFTKSIASGPKRFTMDIRKVKQGMLCLTVTETGSDRKEIRRINVFDSAETVETKAEGLRKVS